MRIKGTSRTCLGCVADKRNAFSSPGSLSAGCAWYAAPAPRFLCFVRRSFRPPCLIVCSSPCICYFVLCRFTVHCCRFGGPLVGSAAAAAAVSGFLGSSASARPARFAPLLLCCAFLLMHFCWAESVLTDLLGFPLFFFPCVASCLSPLVPHRWMCLLFLFCFYYFRSRL